MWGGSSNYNEKEGEDKRNEEEFMEYLFKKIDDAMSYGNLKRKTSTMFSHSQREKYLNEDDHNASFHSHNSEGDDEHSSPRKSPQGRKREKNRERKSVDKLPLRPPVAVIKENESIDNLDFSNAAGDESNGGHEGSSGTDNDSSEEPFYDYFTSSIQNMSRRDLRFNQKAEIQEEDDDSKWSSQLDFFAESPYYDGFAEKEMAAIGLLSETLNDISNKAINFEKAGLLLCEAAQSLSLSCQLLSNKTDLDSIRDKERVRDALGPEMADVLERVGKVLDDMSHVLKKMFKMIKTALSARYLNGSILKEVEKANELKKQADIQTEISEQLLSRYLRPTAKELTKSTEDVFRFGYGKTDQFNSALLQKVSVKKVLDEIRSGQTNAELNRLRFFKHRIDSRCQANFVMSQMIGKFFNEMQSSFSTCSEMLSKLAPFVNKNIEECEDWLLDYQTNDKVEWQNRESAIIKTLVAMKQGSEIHSCVAQQGRLQTPPENINKDVEQAVQLWEVPDKLAACSRYHRASPPGVLLEGWLYRKNTSLMMSSFWNRNWYILKKDAVFCLHSPEQSRNRASSLSDRSRTSDTVKSKICDVVLCNVREIPYGQSSPRFCFELIVSNQKSIMFQARGPKELRLWVDGIRGALASQLAKGDPTSRELNNDIGLVRESSEYNITVNKRNLSLFRSFLSTDSEDSSMSSYGASMDKIAEGGSDSEESEKQKQAALIKKVMQSNKTCADCGAFSPDWVSLNIGVLVCLECSGVHRSLGVHVSKVRSLTLDSLSKAEASVILSLGNERMNVIWEKEIGPEDIILKPNSSSDRKTREEWIKNKYAKKKFLGHNNLENSISQTPDPEEKLCQELFKAVKSGDVIGIARLLAQGVDVDWKNEKEGGATALELSCSLLKLGVQDAALCARLLVCNGAKTDSLDHKSRQILDLEET